MLIPAVCNKCQEEKTNSEQKNIRLWSTVNVTDNNLYIFECEKNHIQIQTIQDFKFEVIFESGIQAMYQSFFLESVLSFTASYERFHEFFLNILNIHFGLKNDQFVDTFKMVSKQSERQLGAFLFSYLYLFNKKPPTLNNKLLEFRNSVVHKGEIPKENNVFQYAKAIHDYIYDITESLINNFGIQPISTFRGKQVKKVNDLLKAKGIERRHKISSMGGLPKVLDTYQERKKTFETKLAEGKIMFDRHSARAKIYQQLELNEDTVKRINDL